MVRYVGNPGPEHHAFTEWARAQGVEINGVTPTRCQGEGIGITATRDIKAGEVLVSVPISALLTARTIPLSFREKFRTNISVQGLIAAYLCCDEDARTKYAPWRAVWPSFESFAEALPILWPAYLTGRDHEHDISPLPPSLTGIWNSMYKPPSISSAESEGRLLLAKQEQRLRDAFAAVQTAFPDTDWELFVYYWVIANTRCFHYAPDDEEPPADRNDAMALCPFADYFNHADEGCEVTFDSNQYTFRATRDYESGEEIFATYGHHSTDVLWTEYGFIPKENKWDSLSLDDIIFSELGHGAVDLLKEAGYFGNYHVTASGPCFRTEVAAALTYLNPEDWKQYVLGAEPPRFDQSRTDAVTSRWIRRYIEEAKATLLRITELRTRLGNRGDDPRFQLIVFRWRLIIELCYEALSSIHAQK
ncbi:hypothetical protein VTO42DRAFT_1631 [Malbranchea cinnamomea]